MTSNDGTAALAIYEQPRITLIPTEQTTNSAFALAKLAAASGLCKTKKPEDAFFVIMHGYEIGIPAMTALRTIHIIQGVPVTSGEALLAIIRRSGKVEIKITGSATEATVYMKRRDSGEEYTARWDIARAKIAGLTTKTTWQNFPQAFLQWRGVSECSKFLCSDITNGLYTAEEINPDASYNESGEIIEGAAITITTPKKWYEDDDNLHVLSERAFTSGYTSERNGKGIEEIKVIIKPKTFEDYQTGRDAWFDIKRIAEERRAAQPAITIATPEPDATIAVPTVAETVAILGKPGEPAITEPEAFTLATGGASPFSDAAGNLSASSVYSREINGEMVRFKDGKPVAPEPGTNTTTRGMANYQAEQAQKHVDLSNAEMDAMFDRVIEREG